ncbi:pirin family protein [Stenotrophomonas chelatiphaga]|uniref:pirin family protein n=1 Tax=Stenotrophomonas chelatiphaga TaxID=517011 RepID=UPI00289B8441|nr:pirin family protein [Stenotrophomonas chelatiphaga]
MNARVQGDSLPRRGIAHRTRGHGHGPITRLMSPSDLGQRLKPFVFLDTFSIGREAMSALADMPLHPHSGIATVTVFTEGEARYSDPELGTGTLTYGGVEWMRAGSGVWHGKEISPGDAAWMQGFQLWLALPAELENAAPVSCYIEAAGMRHSGPAHVIIGSYEGVQSPVPAPAGINYLLVTLKAGQHWTYRPPTGHTVGWLALAKGGLQADGPIRSGEMVVFESSEAPIVLHAAEGQDAVFVLGSAVPHPHDLHLGYYSVHTSSAALEKGERRIAELERTLRASGDRRTAVGTIPVFR